MNHILHTWIILPLVGVLTLLASLGAAPASSTSAPTTPPAPPTLEAPAIPTLYIAGDSTAAVNSSTQKGWGIGFQDYFDPAKLKVVNGAKSGLSSRTFINNGSWEAIISKVKPYDFVILQFGHNDNGPVDSFRFRGTMPSLGEETQEAHNAQGQLETVHTYGWYMRKMINEVKAKNANPIVVSMTPRGEWVDGKIERGFGDYARLAGELAKAEGIRFIDLTNIVADQYQELGPAAVKGFFPADTTHTNKAGADINAHAVLAGIRALHEYTLINAMTAQGRAIEVASPKYALAPKLPVPRGAAPEVFNRWLNLPTVPDNTLPTLFLIGDSTVRNGRGDGVDGQWGWGDALAVYFDPAKVNLVNRAVGGTTAGSFMTGRWPATRDLLKKGDFVFMQFGTNAESEQPYTTNLRKYVAEIREKGATPVICTLVPRNAWSNGQFSGNDSHAAWARTVAQELSVGVVDLYPNIAKKYTELGQEKTTALFADQRVHTNREGAELNAAVAIEQMRALKDDPIGKFLREKPAANW